MPQEAIPLVNDLQSGDEELAGASPQALNVCVDGSGAVRRRPGIGAYFTTTDLALPQAPHGLHATEDGTVFAVAPLQAGSPALRVYRVAPGGVTEVGAMAGERRPTFAETEMLLVIAAGQTISKVVLSDPTAVTALGGSPPRASHVIHNALSLLANDVVDFRSMIRFSGQATGTVTYEPHETWSIAELGGAGAFTAEAAPDPIAAVGENTNEVWAFGSRTLQLFVPTPSITNGVADAYAVAGTMEVGCAAPYSVVKREGEFYWLDHARRFVKSAGRGTEVLSQGLHRVVQGFGRVNDCYGYRVLVGQVDGVVWTFPTEGRTFFLQEGAGWSDWTAWDPHSGNHLPFPVTAHTYDRVTATNIVGLAGTSVGVLQRGLAEDVLGEDEPTPIVASVTTGFLNRGTDARKWCQSVRLSFRRDDSSAPPDVRGYLQYRDSLGPWEPPIPVVIDGADPVCVLNSLGTYRRRQWRYSFSDEANDLVLVSAQESFSVVD